MPNALPTKVLLREDGPREGFQMLAHSVPTEQKLQLIKMLCETGVRSIETTSFVRADRLPQLADAEQVAAGLPEGSPVRFRALYLNQKGLERAMNCSKLDVEGYILLAASETFLKKNNNQTLTEAIEAIPSWLQSFTRHGLSLERIMISTAWGDNDEGPIPSKTVLSICKRVLDALPSDLPLPELTFADTTGWANPKSVQALIAESKARWPEVPLGLHLHDTRGTGMANVYAGLSEGVDRLDCSVGGMGGCPFSPGAAGNVPTEDVAFLCEQLGIETGLQLDRYISCAKFAEQLAGKPLPGKLKDGGLLHVSN